MNEGMFGPNPEPRTVADVLQRAIRQVMQADGLRANGAEVIEARITRAEWLIVVRAVAALTETGAQ